MTTPTRKEPPESVPSPGAPSVPEPPNRAFADASALLLISEKLNGLDDRFMAFSEKYGRVEALLESLNNRLSSIEMKLDNVHKDVEKAKNWITATVVIGGLLIAAAWGIFEFVAPHITWNG